MWDTWSRKKIIIVSVVVGFVITLTLLFLFNKKPQQAGTVTQSSPNSTDNNTASTYSVPKPTDSTIVIHTKSGATVQVSNVYKTPIASLSEDGVSFADNSDYYIAYYPQDQSFTIAIKNTDINTARQEAEKAFLQTLNINQAQACDLNVLLSVPIDVNEEASGKDYGLSFCPNGEPFPN